MRDARGPLTTLCLVVAAALAGCGGVSNDPDAGKYTTVIVETLRAGTTELLEVSAEVVVQGVRGQVNLTDGWALLQRVPLGSQDPPRGPMTVTAPGYVTVSRTIELSKYSYTPVSVEMEPADPASTGSLRGHVRSSTGAPITSAVVRFAQPSTGGTIEVSAFTDSTGLYTIGGVPAGEVTALAQATGYVSQTRTAWIAPDSSGANPSIDFALLAGDTRVTVNGVVISLVSGAPVAGAQVTIADLLPVTSSATGSFTVPGVPVGNQSIRALATDFDDYNATIAVSPGMDPVQVMMAPVSPAPPSGPYTISGKVTLLGRADNSGAVVSAFETSRGVDMGSYTTGADGAYYLFVPPGQYRIEARFGDDGVARAVELKTGRILTGIDFVLAP